MREAILMACLAALGAVRFREQSAENHRQLAALLRRERRLTRELRALREKGRALRREGHALQHDRYFVERVARADLGWRPSLLREPGLAPPGAPPPEAPSALVQGLPSLPPSFPSPFPAPRPSQSPLPARPAPAPPAAPPPPAPDPMAAQQLLAALGYASVGHFQNKMMRGRADGRLDAATVTRAQQLAELIHRLGYDSVKAFQRRNRLTPDGIMGRRTEQRARDLLRRRGPTRSGSYLAVSDRDRRGG